MRELHTLPLIHDHHTHVSLYAAVLDAPRLDGLAKAGCLDLLRGLPGDRVSVVLGWNAARVAFEERDLSGLPPAVVLNQSLHGFLLTPAAREALGPLEPEVVEQYRNDTWRERNLPKVLAFLGRLARFTPEKLRAFLEALRGLGVGSTEDLLLLGGEALEILGGAGFPIPAWVDPETYRNLDPPRRERVQGLKLFLDGALGTRTAALHRPFLGGGDGLLVHDDEALVLQLETLAAWGRPVAIHAIGGRAIEQALGTLERLDRAQVTLPGIRLEHVQFISALQARRARQLGLTLSMQPNFTSDSVDYQDRLEPDLLEANNPFRMLIDSAGFVPGVDLLFGTDGMPHGIAYSLGWSLFPPFPVQRLTLPEWLAGHGPSRGPAGQVRVRVDPERREARLVTLPEDGKEKGSDEGAFEDGDVR